jgi:hypothetical protein
VIQAHHLLRPRVLCTRCSYTRVTFGIWRAVILGLVVQIARPLLAPALRTMAATTRAELPLRADGIAPVFLPATLPLRVSLLRHSLSLAHPSGFWAHASRRRGHTDRIT